MVMGKTLGIIGKGNLIQHFFKHLRDSSTHSDEGYDAEVFFSEIERVLFYSCKDRYNSAVEYAESGGYKAVQKVLGEKVDVTDNFNDFFRDSGVVVDTTQGYIPGEVKGKFPHQEQRKGSLLEYICLLRTEGEVNRKEVKVKAEGYSWRKDYDEYLLEKKEKGRILMTEPEFQTHWEDSKRIAEAIIGLKEYGYTFGPRTEMAFPFSVGMIQKRGEEINGYLHKDPFVNSPNIPTYINLVNEPCSSSNLLVGKCPELAPYVVACAGYDLERINEQINQDEKVLAEIRTAKKGMKVPDNFKIQLAYVWGTHDLIVPVFSAGGEHKTEADNILRRFNEPSLYRAVKDAVGRYLKSTLEGGGDINQEVDRCLLKTILCAVRSRGKAFSVYPEFSEQHPELSEPPLCNGYFQRSAGENTGMFLMGAHRFQNGKVVGELK